MSNQFEHAYQTITDALASGLPGEWTAIHPYPWISYVTRDDGLALAVGSPDGSVHGRARAAERVAVDYRSPGTRYSGGRHGVTVSRSRSLDAIVRDVARRLLTPELDSDYAADREHVSFIAGQVFTTERVAAHAVAKRAGQAGSRYGTLNTPSGAGGEWRVSGRHVSIALRSLDLATALRVMDALAGDER